MRVLVTGATGYLGSALCEALLEKGHEVYGLIRNESRKKELPEGVRDLIGDLASPEPLKEKLSEFDVIFHAGALVRVWVPDRSLYDAINVHGTEKLIRFAADAGVRHIIYTSSFIALGPSQTPDDPLTEEEKPKAPYFNDYHRTKSESLLRVRNLQKEGLPVSITFPGVIFGPGRRTLGNYVTVLIQDFVRGKIPGYPGSGHQVWNFAYIEDVVKGHILIMEKAQPGSSYVLGGDNISLRHFFETVASLIHRKPPRLSIAPPFLKVFATLQFWFDRLLGREPTMSAREVNIYISNWPLSSEKAKRELGYNPLSFKESIKKTIDWMKREELIHE